jgi:hypothetical protein
VNTRSAGAVLVASSGGANRTVRSGNARGVAPSTCDERKVHAASTRVDSVTGAPLSTSALTRYVPPSAGSANPPPAAASSMIRAPSRYTVSFALPARLSPGRALPSANSGGANRTSSPSRAAHPIGGVPPATLGPNTPRFQVCRYVFPGWYVVGGARVCLTGPVPGATSTRRVLHGTPL